VSPVNADQQAALVDRRARPAAGGLAGRATLPAIAVGRGSHRMRNQGHNGQLAVTARLELMRARMIRILREHVSHHGRCVACGGAAWPFDHALLAEVNIGLINGAAPLPARPADGENG
jgi:hypothetical protein